MKRLLMAGGMLAALALAGPASAADGKAVVSANKCASCHKMAGPAAKTIAEVRQRKAPDLFYAGSKFKKEWLEKFLQSPTKLRPAGTVYINHIKLDGEQDVIGDVPGCGSKLSAADAGAAAEYLMTLKDAKMPAGAAKLGDFSKARAKLTVSKQEACDSCHQIGGKGGVSCPTLDGAASRLNPDWIYSFVKDPQYWDPKAWMAKRELDDATLQLIVNYIASLE